MMKIETILTLAALGAAAALLMPKKKTPKPAAPGGYSPWPVFGGSAGAVWQPLFSGDSLKSPADQIFGASFYK